MRPAVLYTLIFLWAVFCSESLFAQTDSLTGFLSDPEASQQSDPSAAEAEDAGQDDKEAADPDDVDSLLSLDIEQLRKTTVAPAFAEVVTSVNRQESTVGLSPAAVFVITPEMIRRSGARNIPELLRLVPGLHVAKIDSNVWAISSRGFNDRYADKLLVQIDGRSVYTPIFGGVYWDVQDYLLEDIARIEVIRGPGATVWGANAVNGVINIITKDSKDTVGTYITGGGGTEEVGFAGARVGGCQLGGDLHWRIYTKWFDRDNGFRENQPTYDAWKQGRSGGRMDWTPTDCDKVTVQGDYYQHANGDGFTPIIFNPFTLGITLGPPEQEPIAHAWGGNILGRWTHQVDEDRNWSFQMYWDRTDRTNYFTNERVDVLDVDFQHSSKLGCYHELIWGLGYRHYADIKRPVTDPVDIVYDPEERTYDLYSGFVQDQVTLLEDELFFTIGTKLEKNSFTDFEVQPSARILWAMQPSKVVWAAVSRAVRTPDRAEHNQTISNSFFDILGTTDFQSEELIAYELGYRSQPEEWFSWDIALFYNDYDKLFTVALAFPNLVYSNDLQGEAYGLEITGKVDMTPCWRLEGYYALLRRRLNPGPTSFGIFPNIEEGPRNQVSLWSSWDLGCNTELDAIARYVDELPIESTPSYITLDLRLARHFDNGLELAVVGQNLLDSPHKEFGGDALGLQYTEVQSGVYGQLTWRY